MIGVIIRIVVIMIGGIRGLEGVIINVVIILVSFSFKGGGKN